MKVAHGHRLSALLTASLSAVLLFANTLVHASVGLSITPSTITNDYIGTISLTVTVLTSGQTITVEAYADVNTNGIIDSADLGIRSFQVTDGKVPLVAGLRNLNVPGDDDGATNGQIQATLYVPSVAAGILSTGKALFRVFDPSGGFTPITQAVTVVQRILPQGVTGRLTAAPAGLLPLTNVTALLFNGNVASGVSSTLTDTNGNYSFYCLPGSYGVGFVNIASNKFISDGSRVFTVSCGQFTTNNLIVTNGTQYIAGRVTDSATGKGIPYLALDANATNNLSVFTFTDTNGNYAVQVTPNVWSVHPSTDATSDAGYVPPTRIDVSVGIASVSNVNFAMTQPTSLIYGTVKDKLNNPIVGVQMTARDQPNLFHSLGRTVAPNGNYSIGVQAKTWNPGHDKSDLAFRGLIGSSSNTTLIDGVTTNMNFVVTRTNFPVLSQELRLYTSQFRFLVTGMAGQTYTIQTATNVNATNWLAFWTTSPACSLFTVLHTNATNSRQFYRAVVAP